MDGVNISNQIMSIINQISEKLGVAVERVYPVLRKQAYVEGATNVFWIIIITGIAGVIIYNMHRVLLRWEKDEEDGICPEERRSAEMMAIALVIGVALIFMPSIKNTITAFMNPDWYIFNQLLAKLV